MSERRSATRRNSQATWWTAAGVLLCLIAIVVWGGMYARRRALALGQLINVELRAPGSLPAALHPWLPRWMLEMSMATGTTREEWLALRAFPEVEAVTFSGADLTDDDLRLLRNLRRLVRLELEQNPGITDAGLRHIEGMPRLEHVRLWGCGVSDEGLKSLAALPKLQLLSLQSSRLSGTGVAHLAGAKHLSSCIFDFSVPAASPGRFDLLPALDELRIHGKGLTNTSLQHFALPPSLSCLDLTRTGLNDTEGFDLVEQFARVPGIAGVDYLDLRGIVNDEASRKRFCERLNMEEISPGEFHRP
jgi:hypothetical protein